MSTPTTHLEIDLAPYLAALSRYQNAVWVSYGTSPFFAITLIAALGPRELTILALLPVWLFAHVIVSAGMRRLRLAHLFCFAAPALPLLALWRESVGANTILLAMGTLLGFPLAFAGVLAWRLRSVENKTAASFPYFPSSRNRAPAPWRSGRFLSYLRFRLLGFVLAPLPFLVLVLPVAVIGENDLMASLLGTLLATFALNLATSIHSYFRRRAQSELAQGFLGRPILDDRAPVLLLRSFSDDSVTITERVHFWDAVNGITARILFFLPFQPDVDIRLEEVFVRHAWPIGPFVAVAAPALPDVDPGAIRAPLPPGPWQEHILRKVEEASLILVIAGESAGLRWEFEKIVANPTWRAKLFAILPPKASLDLFPPTLANSLAYERGIAVYYEGETPCLVVGTRRHEEDYAALLPLLSLPVERTNFHPSP